MPLDLSAASAALYPSMAAAVEPAATIPATPVPAPAPAPAPAPPPGPNVSSDAEVEAVAAAFEHIERAIPDTIREMRQADAARRLVGSPQREFAAVLTEEQARAAFPHVSPQVVDAVTHEAREVLADLGLTGAEARDLFQPDQPDGFDPRAPLEQHYDAMVDLLNDEFGNDATRAYKAAQALAQRDPRVARVLDQTGAGNNPRVVLALARAGLRLQRAGKL